MRNDDLHDRAGAADPVDLLEHGDDVIEMLEDVVRDHLIEGAVGERPWVHVQIVHDIRVGGSQAVEMHRPGSPLASCTENEGSAPTDAVAAGAVVGLSHRCRRPLAIRMDGCRAQTLVVVGQGSITP
jgi:hypothetical protein